MQYRFFNIFPEKSDLFNQKMFNINPFLIENNLTQIEKIYNFYKADNVNLLYVNGFLGTGKADIVKYSTSFLADDVLVLKYNCFNSTVLDDILLSLFRDFKNLSAQNIIADPKVKSENFVQKVNSYFSQIERPFLIVIDSFESILEENRQDIIDFIHHLNSMDKVKIIIIGRTFAGEAFKDIPLERVTTLAFENSLFEKYLKSEKIKASNSIIDEFYKHTRGYYLFTALSIAIIKNKNLSLSDFLTKMKDSFLSFNKFLSKEVLTLIPQSEKNLFCFLSVIRHPISIDLLKKLDFYNEEQLNSLLKNSIVLHDEKNIYVQDYLKDDTDDVVASATLHKIRNYIIDLYQAQLPLKPMDRDISISRQTMRKEIEFHRLFLPKHNLNFEPLPVDMNYMSYTKLFSLQEKPSAADGKEPKDVTLGIDLTKRKNISINLQNLPLDKNQKQVSVHDDSSKVLVHFSEIIEFIKKAEKIYQYADVIELAQKALSMNSDPTYQQSLGFLYSKIAKSYHKLAQADKAVEYYNLLLNLLEEKGDFTKANSVKFNIATIFYESYKIDKAKELFNEIINDSKSSNLIVVKAYLKLAGIEEDASLIDKSLEYYEAAFKYTDSISDEEVLAELYFKYALIMDDKSDYKSAIEYYNKCISISEGSEFNHFLSPAYSNLATLYLEQSDLEFAAKYYTKAYEIDLQNDNWEGVYDSSAKLAALARKKQPPLVVEYLNAALSAAKHLKDAFYIISASLAMGDYYCDIKKDEFALKYYLSAFDLAENNLSQDNIYKIEVRINDVKFRLGEEKFNNLSEIIYEQERE